MYIFIYVSMYVFIYTYKCIHRHIHNILHYITLYLIYIYIHILNNIWIFPDTFWENAHNICLDCFKIFKYTVYDRQLGSL